MQTNDDALASLVIRSLGPLDALRAWCLRRTGHALRPLLARPSLRHAVLGGAGVVVAFVLCTAQPIWMLALGPLVFGIPHLVSDLRYLVLQRQLHRRPLVVALMLAPLALAVTTLPLLAVAGVATVGAALCGSAHKRRRLLVACTGGALIALGVRLGYRGAVLFAHLHHAIAIALWWAMHPKRTRLEAWVPVLTLLGLAVGFTGLLDARLFTVFTQSADLLSPDLLIVSLAPDPVADDSLRWVWAFAFGQSVHYLVWLRMIPDDRRGRAAPRPFVASYRALVRDLGHAPFALALALVLGLLTWALCDLTAARDGYLRLALFHGPLEVACAALAFAEGRRP